MQAHTRKKGYLIISRQYITMYVIIYGSYQKDLIPLSQCDKIMICSERNNIKVMSDASPHATRIKHIDTQIE